jgi:hypothetical protein
VRFGKQARNSSASQRRRPPRLGWLERQRQPGRKRGRERSARRRDGSDFRHSNGFAVSGSHRQASVVVNDLAALAGLFCESGFSVGRLIDTRKLAIMPTPTRATASRLKPKLSPRGGWPRARGISLGDSCPLLDFSERWRSEQRKPQPIVGAYEAALLELGLTRTSPGAKRLPSRSSQLRRKASATLIGFESELSRGYGDCRRHHALLKAVTRPKSA